jgi:peptidylprolyl isomerase/peptidyl-prolyl cis-trans isomerase D
MAILSKIRERSLFLIIIIGLALFAFVLEPSKLGDFFNSSKVNEIGEVNGEAISRQEFATAVDEYKKQAGGRVSDMQATKTVWDNILRKKIYQNQLSEAGITVGEEDVWKEITSAPSVKDNPQFLNEAGLFDEAKFKQFLATEKENKSQMWLAWSNYMNQIRDNSERNTYNNLVTAGLGASLKEGENEYLIENTKMGAQFVYVSYSSVADSLVTVSKSEIESYIKDNPNDFQVDASRDLSYVKFDINATTEDKEAIKSDVATLIEDFKNTTDNKEFLAENNSDVNLVDNFIFKESVNSLIADEMFAGKLGDVFGPYEDKGFFKVSKITAVSKIPDSVKASHILIPFVGAQRATPDITRTEEEAKKLADSILIVVKRSKRKFADLAKEFSSDKSNSEKSGELDWFNYNRMTPAFRDFSFTNKEGTIDIVKTPFGFHVVRIDAQKNIQKVLKLATFGTTIVASEATENLIFQQAEQFALETSKDKKFFSVAKENAYTTKQAIGLKVLDESVPGLGNQRQIVSWAFGKDVKPGNFKRFDLEGSHVVAFITRKTEKGLMPAANATSSIKPILVNKKKANFIADKLKGSTLQEIATANKTTVRSANGFNLKTTTLSGVGVEPKIVGAMYNAELNKMYNNIEGTRGVFAFIVTNKDLPTALPNYDTNRKQISQARKRLTYKIYEAVKKASNIEDNRASLYSN